MVHETGSFQPKSVVMNPSYKAEKHVKLIQQATEKNHPQKSTKMTLH